MPDYAYLQTDLRCPHCGEPITDLVWFRWGYCPGYGPRPSSTYREGEAIRWRTAPDGTIPAWTYFCEDGRHAGANLGDPSVRDLVIRDRAQEWLVGPCPRCGSPHDGAAVEIIDGALRRAWLTGLVELGGVAEIYVIGPDGQLRPMPQWDDGPMDYISLTGP